VDLLGERDLLDLLSCDNDLFTFELDSMSLLLGDSDLFGLIDFPNFSLSDSNSVFVSLKRERNEI